MKLEYTIKDNDIMVKDFLLQNGVSRNFGRKIKLYGKIYVNDVEVKNYYNLKCNDKLVIIYDEDKNNNILNVEKPIDILFEDEYLLVINKPINLSSLPSRKHIEDNLISRIHAYFKNNNISSNVHLINRLDFSTSGLVIVAKDGFIHSTLGKENITRKYLAKIEKDLPDLKGKIDLPISRENEYSIRRMVNPNGKRAVTYYQVINTLEKIVELTLETGRTHQIRVHLSYLGSSIVGDKLYGIPGEEMYLHCYFLELMHPITKETYKFTKYPRWYGG